MTEFELSVPATVQRGGGPENAGDAGALPQGQPQARHNDH
jgi:hypothetical protein